MDLRRPIGTRIEQPWDLFRDHRPREVVALVLVAAELGEQRELRLGFDAFGH